MMDLLLFIITVSSSSQWNNLSDLSAWDNLYVSVHSEILI